MVDIDLKARIQAWKVAQRSKKIIQDVRTEPMDVDE